jgi:hypothetical protein
MKFNYFYVPPIFLNLIKKVEIGKTNGGGGGGLSYRILPAMLHIGKYMWPVLLFKTFICPVSVFFINAAYK